MARNIYCHIVLCLLFPLCKPGDSAYPKSWTGPWTLDSGLWTLDSGVFPLKTLSPPKKTSISPPKNLYISPMKLPPPPINISSPKYSVRVFKQTTLFPPPTSPKKPFCLPLKTAPSQKTPLPSPK